MSDYEQMELDVRLESEKSLKENVAKVIQFTYNKRIAEAEENGRPIQAVRNKHEGYGIASEAYSKIQVKEKDIKNGMGDYLALLQVQGEEAVQACARLYDAALNLAMDAIGMAADMNRVLNDLYYGGSPKTPLEEYADSLEDTEPNEFEEADTPDAEDMDENDPEEEQSEEEES
jgi:hypothetical protein